MGNESDKLRPQRSNTAILIRSKAHSNIISRGRADASEILLRVTQETANPKISPCDTNDPEQFFSLGMKYYEGTEAEKNYELAAYWFEKAAALGHADAEWCMSVVHFNGQGLAKDHQRSFEWCRKSAEHGNASAQFSLGWKFSVGMYVPQDFEQAAFWLRKSADQGHTNAQMCLANQYRSGQGLPQSYAEWLFWSTLAERLGHTGASPGVAAWARNLVAANLTPDQVSDVEKRVNRWIANNQKVK